jgi:hypothetical protein
MQRVSLVKSLCLVAGALLAGGAAHAQGVLHTSTGLEEGEHLGTDVAVAGDVNGDGYADTLVSAPFATVGSLRLGRVLVLAGQSGEYIRQHVGSADGEQYGRAVSGAGDVDGDGRDDIVVGAPGADLPLIDAGRAEVRSGSTGALLHSLAGASAHDAFGSAVAGVGDLDQDGHADLIVGAPLADLAGLSSGTARVVSGQTGATLLLLVGSSAYAEFGRTVGSAGDVNGDGTPDLIVGAPHEVVAGLPTGRVRVFSGLTGAVLLTLQGDHPHDEFGFAIAGAGDIDADGAADELVGARFDDASGVNSGSARVFSGADGSVLLELQGAEAHDLFGTSVGGAGDVDADGTPDLLVGAPNDHCFGSSCGAVYVFSGVEGELLFVLHGEPGEQLGWSIAGGGDADGDGRHDLVVGAPWASESAPGSGMARAYAATPWINVGLSLQGAAGDSSFSGSGMLEGLEPVSFLLSGAAPLAPAMLVLGLSVADVPFKGGTLVPFPHFVSPALVTDATGGLTVGGTWPQGVPALTTVALQFWTVDGGSPTGFGSSNGLVALTP